MSTQTLSSVAIDVVDQYHLAGKHLADAYQAGVQRALDAAGDRFAAAVQARSMPEAVKSSLIDAQQRVAGIVVGGLRLGSNAVSAINDRVADGVKGGIGRIAETVSRIDTVFDTNASDSITVLNMPSAQLSLAVASAVAARAKSIGERVGVQEQAVV